MEASEGNGMESFVHFYAFYLHFALLLQWKMETFTFNGILHGIFIFFIFSSISILPSSPDRDGWAGTDRGRTDG